MIHNILIVALSKMLGYGVQSASYETTKLHGGTLGDVQLISGMASCENGELPFKLVRKSQKKWQRYGDAGSWRREYDLHTSGFSTLFTDAFRLPIIYHAVMNEDESEYELWMEYIDGISGNALNPDMYEQASLELGRFQGRLYSEKPELLSNLTNLSDVEYSKNFYLHYRSWKEVYDYIRSAACELPKHLCQMLIEIDVNEDEIWQRIRKLPIVLCHRDFWVTNIFHVNCEKNCEAESRIMLIDWDTSGWGYFGEDIASLISDEADVANMLENYQRCAAAYYRGFGEYVDISHIEDDCIYELILIMFGYRMVEWFKFAKTSEEKQYHLDTLQKVYEMKAVCDRSSN